MSLEKYGLNKPKQLCFTCYEPINEDFEESKREGIPYNERTECSYCGDDSICIMCSWEYDGDLICEKCHIDIEKGCC